VQEIYTSALKGALKYAIFGIAEQAAEKLNSLRGSNHLG